MVCALGTAAACRPSGGAVVAAKQSAEALGFFDLARPGARRSDEQLIAESLVRALGEVMSAVFAERVSKGVLAEQDEPIETLSLHGQHPALRDRVHVRRLKGGADDLEPGVLERLAELGSELAVAIDDEEAAAAKKSVALRREASRNLSHEVPVRVRRDAGDLNRAGRVGDDEQDVVGDESACGPDLGREEVRRRSRRHAPGGTSATMSARRWAHTVVFQRLGDRRPSYAGPSFLSSPWIRQ